MRSNLNPIRKLNGSLFYSVPQLSFMVRSHKHTLVHIKMPYQTNTIILFCVPRSSILAYPHPLCFAFRIVFFIWLARSLLLLLLLLSLSLLLLTRFILIGFQHLTAMKQYEWLISVCLLIVHNAILFTLPLFLFCTYVYFVHISNKLRESVKGTYHTILYFILSYSLLCCTVL